MPSINSSFHSVAEQIITFNNNIVQLLANINSLTTTNNASVPLSFMDSTGAPVTVSLPSFSYLQNQINIMNNNINTIYGLNSNGATIQTGANTFQRIVTVDLNLEPKDITALSVPNKFISQRNYLFDALLDPELFIQLDLTDKIASDVKEILSRRYIVNFEIDSNGNYTSIGKSALSSFTNIFKGQSNIIEDDFLIWQQTTPGILAPGAPEYIEETINLVPNELQYHGIFSVLKSEIDSNNILWYYIDTLTYIEIKTNQPKQLAIGDNLIINMDNANTIYQIKQISNSSSNFKISLLRLSGNQPIPPSVGILKLYSPILKDQTIKIPVGYNEYNILFVKALNTINYLLSKNWSTGIGYFTNDLVLTSNDSYNGQSMQQYYTSVVADYGAALKDLVGRTVPVNKGITPNVPLLVSNNFQVVQTNTHLTNTPEVQLLKSQAGQISNLNTQAQQLSNAIQSKNKQLQVTRFTSPADKQQFMNDLTNLQTQHSSATSLAASINTQILNSSVIQSPTVQPTFAVRGFWTIPAPAIATPSNFNQAQAKMNKPQQIVKFEVEFKRLNKDGTEASIQTYKLYDTSVSPDASSTAAFSNWISYQTQTLKRVLDQTTGLYNWVLDDQNNPDKVNINQLDIPINPNETIEIRIRSISEVGYPDSPLYSDWSNSVAIVFPDSLINVSNHVNTIAQNAQATNVQNSLMATLNNQGLNDLLAQKTVSNNNSTYYMSSNVILSGFKDVSGNSVDLFTHLQNLTNTITNLQNIVTSAQGQLVVTVFNNSTQYVVQKNSVLHFTINCEDYLQPLTGANIPTGRVFANNITVIKDFYLTVENTSNNPLGLLSNITYTSGINTNVYNSAVPQVFWVDDQDNLITSDITGQSKTQIDNQFFWSVNYDSVDQTTVTKLSDNIGNLFSSNGNNSITDILSSTEYNVGYSDPSVLGFIGNNNSLMDISKWMDTINSIASTNKLLTTIHPSVQQITDIQETNSSKVHSLTNTNTVNIPLNIYFKMNALDPSKPGANYQYINLNGVNQNVRHIKELKFLLYNQADNTPFIFSIIFTINRVNVIQQKTLSTSPSQIAQAQPRVS